MTSSEQLPRLSWDIGTAYDLFMSLDVLHHPEEFGLRGAWAAGVRSRLPVDDRELLHYVHQMFFKGPYYWIYNLPEPKDGATVLNALEQIPPEERFDTLIYYPNIPPEAREVLERVSTHESWTEQDQRVLMVAYQNESISRKDVAQFLDMWTQSRMLGERYLKALRAYCNVFFDEEETRIRSALQAATERAKKLAEQLDLPTLLEEISEGFHFAELPRVSELVLIPSFWITPLVAYIQITSEQMLFVFGGRPTDASLVPGEVVPDALFRPLKALADPTRLRILRYLTAAPLTPAQLARRLRLRAPTVVYHLRALRLAGLVHLTIESGKKVHYTARSEAVTTMFAALQGFLEKDLSNKD